jgi:hypothetical protein
MEVVKGVPFTWHTKKGGTGLAEAGAALFGRCFSERYPSSTGAPTSEPYSVHEPS